MVKSVGVFCGSKEGTNPKYVSDATALGNFLGANNITLIYGGGNKGIMGALANGAIANNGKVIGVIPQLLLSWEAAHNGLYKLDIVENMHVRKTQIYELSEVIIILPGGFGTFDEMFEAITWNNLKIHQKKIYILNTDGYYNSLITFMQHTINEGFAYYSLEETVEIFNTNEKLFEALC